MTDEIVIGGDSVDIPAGTYPATVASVTVKTSVAYGDFRAWDFALDGGSIVGGATSMNTGKKSKGGKWIAALLGRQPAKDEKVTVIGLPCLVVVEENDDGWPKVSAVLPPMAKGSVGPPGPTVPTTPAPAESPPSQPVAVGQVTISEDLPF